MQALDEGADALECDVRLTADGHLVCVHDRRIDRTTNARGVVSTLTLDELDDLDAASWKKPWADLDDEAAEIDPEHNRVLTLRRLLEVVRDYDRRRRPRDRDQAPDPLRRAGRATAGRAARRVRLGRRRVARAGHELLRCRAHPGPAARARSSRWSCCIEGQSWKMTRADAAPGLDRRRPASRSCAGSPRLAGRLRRTGHRIQVWVVNTEEDLDLCLSSGSRR